MFPHFSPQQLPPLRSPPEKFPPLFPRPNIYLTMYISEEEKNPPKKNVAKRCKTDLVVFQKKKKKKSSFLFYVSVLLQFLYIFFSLSRWSDAVKGKEGSVFFSRSVGADRKAASHIEFLEEEEGRAFFCVPRFSRGCFFFSILSRVAPKNIYASFERRVKTPLRSRTYYTFPQKRNQKKKKRKTLHFGFGSV